MDVGEEHGISDEGREGEEGETEIGVGDTGGVVDKEGTRAWVGSEDGGQNGREETIGMEETKGGEGEDTWKGKTSSLKMT